MIKSIVIFSVLPLFCLAQGLDSITNNLHNKKNIIKFADHLFRQKDYLRAAEEYLRLDEYHRSDELNFKIALSFSTIGEYLKAETIFDKINSNSEYFQHSKLEMLKILFLEGRFRELKEKTFADDQITNSVVASIGNKIFHYSFLKSEENILSVDEFIQPFDFGERDKLTELYQLKINPPYKDPLLSSILSAIIPGAGKFYTGEITDGIFALISTGLFSFLAYDNFKAGHDFRGWLFTGLAAGFYSGNIYGSYASAQIYNVRFMYEFNLNLDSFIKSKNYFIPEYDFCK